LGGLIGLGHDLRHRHDLPQRPLAERADGEEAGCRTAPDAVHLAIALDHEAEAMRIGTRQALREQASYQRLVEIGPEAGAVEGEVGLDNLGLSAPRL